MVSLPRSEVPSARRYFAGAKGHLGVLKIVCGSGQLDQHFTPNITWVALQNTSCLVIELALKAAIATFPGEAPGKRGHDLSGLLNDARRLQILETIQASTDHRFQETLVKFVEQIGDNYLTHDYRYLESDEMIVHKSHRSLKAVSIVADLILGFVEPRLTRGGS